MSILYMQQEQTQIRHADDGLLIMVFWSDINNKKQQQKNNNNKCHINVTNAPKGFGLAYYIFEESYLL